MSQADIAIVVLCWRNQDHLPGLLRSISMPTAPLRLEVVICHNDSSSGPPLPAQDLGLVVHELVSGANLGYGGGNNFAIAWAREHIDPRYFLVLNSDIELHEGALNAIVAWADMHPEHAVVGAVHDDPSRPGYRCFGGNRYNRMLSLISPGAPDLNQELDYVHGAAVLLRADAFNGESVFAEHYFLFFEELELAARVRARGKRIGCCPDCRVTHFEGASRTTSHEDFYPEVAEYFENINALRFTRDHYWYFLPTVLAFRTVGKFLYLALTGRRTRLIFWALAIGDFLFSRVRRFPFQAGWNPGGCPDRVIDAAWPSILKNKKAGCSGS